LPAAIDWQQPWFAPYRELGEAVDALRAQGLSLVAALNAQRGEPRVVQQVVQQVVRQVVQQKVVQAPHFVEPQAQGSEAYEAFIARTASVPTRDNRHDFFNALVWLRFPALKRRLNALHAAEIARDGISPKRGAVRDALTLFDENGAALSAPPVLAQALRERRWADLFGAQRGLWSEARLTLVGHALLEKLVEPRKALTAHVWFAEAGGLDDASGAPASLNPATKPDAPLPVLGVPGWWRANEAPGFYADAEVFRPARNLRSTGSARPCRS
jgi:hypothetical protein